MKLQALLSLILAGALLAPGARAEPSRRSEEENKAEALRAYQKGMAHYNLDEYDQAIEQFEAGYRAVPQAVFLYNIAQAHRLANRPQRALDFYRKYLRQDPGARNFREVQERIEALEKLLADSNRPPEHTMPPEQPPAAPKVEPPPPAPQAEPLPPAPAPKDEPPPPPAPKAEPPPPAPLPAPAAAVEAPAAVVVKDRPARRSRTLPIVLGVVGGALVVGAAVGLGVYFGTAANPQVPVWQAVMP